MRNINQIARKTPDHNLKMNYRGLTVQAITEDAVYSSEYLDFPGKNLVAEEDILDHMSDLFIPETVEYHIRRGQYDIGKSVKVYGKIKVSDESHKKFLKEVEELKNVNERLKEFEEKVAEMNKMRDEIAVIRDKIKYQNLTD